MSEEDLIKEFIKKALNLDFDVDSIAVIAIGKDFKSRQFMHGNYRDIIFCLEEGKQMIFDQLKARRNDPT